MKIEASVGQAVNPGDSIVVLEAMKMEIPIVAPEAGTVASINVSVGQAVEVNYPVVGILVDEKAYHVAAYEARAAGYHYSPL